MRFWRRSVWLCRVCGRACNLFESLPGEPMRRTCSYECRAALNAVLDEFGAQEDGERLVSEKLTDMEREAIRAARLPLYEALVRIGRAEAFNSASAEEMDSVIRAVWDGVRLSMQKQSSMDAVPW